MFKGGLATEIVMRANFQVARICVRSIHVMVLGLIAVSVFGQSARKILAQTNPVYPPMAKTLHLTGTVKVQVVIAPDGQIKEAKVIGGHPLFVETTLEALKRWKYAPANAETTADLEFNFRP
jgi:TonB family protein